MEGNNRLYDTSWSRRVALTVAMSLAGIGGAGAAQQEEVQVTDQRPLGMQSEREIPRGAETRSVTVRYDDLKLEAKAGGQTLYSRLETASRAVCSPEESRNLAMRREWTTCYANALDDAVAETGIGSVLALHQSRTGRTPKRLLVSGF